MKKLKNDDYNNTIISFDTVLANTKNPETQLAIQAEQYYSSVNELTFDQIRTIVEEARKQQKVLETPEPKFAPLMTSWENVSSTNKSALIDKTMATARSVFNKKGNKHFANNDPFAQSMKGHSGESGFTETIQAFVAYLNLLKKMPKADQDYFFKSFPEGTGMACLNGTRDNLANVYEKARTYYSKDTVLHAADMALRTLLGDRAFDEHNGMATRPDQLGGFN